MMSLLTYFYANLLRIILLLLAILIAFSIGIAGYNSINLFLASHNYPCLEVVSALIILVPPVGLMYGHHIRRFFWQRMNRYDVLIALVSFLLGVLFSLFPIFSPVSISTACIPSPSLIERLTYLLGSGLVTVLLAFIGVDFGVVLKHLSLHLTYHVTKHQTETRTKKSNRRKRT